MRITKAMAVELLQKYAALDPDRLASPHYVRANGLPECIVGNILVNDCNVPAEKLNNDSFPGATCAISDKTAIEYIKKQCGVDLTSAAQKLLGDAQKEQDFGWTWSNAVSRAFNSNNVKTKGK